MIFSQSSMRTGSILIGSFDHYSWFEPFIYLLQWLFYYWSVKVATLFIPRYLLHLGPCEIPPPSNHSIIFKMHCVFSLCLCTGGHRFGYQMLDCFTGRAAIVQVIKIDVSSIIFLIFRCPLAGMSHCSKPTCLPTYLWFLKNRHVWKHISSVLDNLHLTKQKKWW